MMNAVVGGVLIGLSAVWLMLSLGRIAGVSGIVASAVMKPRASNWALVFIAGIGIGGIVGAGLIDLPIVRDAEVITWALVLGGLLVGVGTRMGSGCTSGHGVCGIARLSRRSIVATVVFILVGMAAATLVHGS